MILPTRGGSLTLSNMSNTAARHAVTDPERCGACGGASTLLLITVRATSGAVADRIRVCGDCLAEGLALVFGRRHVQQGGNVALLDAETVGRCVCAQHGANPSDPGLRCVHAKVCAARIAADARGITMTQQLRGDYDEG